ncbi:MAG TPA: HNH endonuclease signature motif containing protein [Verrucomicrobiae bacterium]|nr:HNH endonuclease signature motif containing protein [Verrucomicrobiae bacterium]
MDARLRATVAERAGNCCEYCRLPARFSRLSHQIDHIIPQQHGGLTEPANLAFACFHCNGHKGPNLTGIDPDTGVIKLFNPRTERWSEHFRWQGARIVGISAVGRATVAVLAMNDEIEVDRRAVWLATGLWRPTEES